RDLRDHRGHHFHVRQLGQHVPDLDGNGRAGEPDDVRRSRRHHHHVCPDPGLPLLGVVHHAQRQADDQQDQRDFQRHGHDADQRPHRPVDQVPENHFVHHESGAIALLLAFSFGAATTGLRGNSRCSTPIAAIYFASLPPSVCALPTFSPRCTTSAPTGCCSSNWSSVNCLFSSSFTIFSVMSYSSFGRSISVCAGNWMPS